MAGYRRYLCLLLVLLGLLTGLLAGLATFVNANYVDTTLKNKVYLLEARPDLIFAGDSRAQRQLDPLCCNRSNPQRRAVNVASESASLLSLAELLAQYPAEFARATVVVSVSANQLNDGAIRGGAYPEAMIARMSLWRQLRVFAPDNMEVLQIYYRRSFKYLRKKLGGRLKNQQENPETLGFKPIREVWNPASLDVAHELASNPWHRNWSINGDKRQLFEPALLEVRARVGRLLVLVGPVAPGYRRVMDGTRIMEQERDFDRALAALCSQYGIDYRCYSFDDRFADADFYDPFHLNAGGAEKLTRLLMTDQQL